MRVDEYVIIFTSKNSTTSVNGNYLIVLPKKRMTLYAPYRASRRSRYRRYITENTRASYFLSIASLHPFFSFSPLRRDPALKLEEKGTIRPVVSSHIFRSRRWKRKKKERDKGGSTCIRITRSKAEFRDPQGQWPAFIARIPMGAFIFISIMGHHDVYIYTYVRTYLGFYA